MKKKIVTILLAMVMCLTGIVSYNVHVYAQDILAEDVDISEIMTEDALIGYSQSQNRGVYYAQGYSIINDAGGGKIGIAGITDAAVRCKVSVTAIVERLSGGVWTRVTSYSATNTNALTVGVSKTLLVANGYYYRVRSSHYAASDYGSSCTGALWMYN